jgi:hypothetical protein
MQPKRCSASRISPCKLPFATVLFVAGFLVAACSGGSSGSNANPPGAAPTITSVTVSPQSVQMVTGGTQQFTATVQGTGNFNTAVTWSVTGLGSINQSGLYTASNTPGTPFVTATSVEDATKSGTANITVTVSTVTLLGWYGTLVPSNSAPAMPMDFDLKQTGTSLQSGPVLIIAPGSGTTPPCANFDLANGEAYGPVITPSPNAPLPQMSGTVTGQQVSLSYTPYYFGQQSTITLTGTMSTDAYGQGIITGTFATPASACLPSATSGTFTFNQYLSFSGTYSGNLPYGNPPVQVPLTIVGNVNPNNQNNNSNQDSLSYGMIPAPFGCPASPSYQMQNETAGRFFHVWTNFAGSEVGSTNMVAWGLVAGPDQQGNQLNVFLATGGVGLPNVCFSIPSPLSGTLNKQ